MNKQIDKKTEQTGLQADRQTSRHRKRQTGNQTAKSIADGKKKNTEGWRDTNRQTETYVNHRDKQTNGIDNEKDSTVAR